MGAHVEALGDTVSEPDLDSVQALAEALKAGVPEGAHVFALDFDAPALIGTTCLRCLQDDPVDPHCPWTSSQS